MRMWDNFSISWTACVGFSLMLLILPLQWCFAVLISSVFHELCHYLAVRACGKRVLFFQISFGGAVMETEPMSPGKALFCTLAGPVGALFLLLFARWMPRTAICALVQSFYNLIPVFPLDGGRVLRCLTGLLFRERTAEGVRKGIQIVCLLVMSLAALRFSAGIIVLVLLLNLWLKVIREKNTLQTSR